jgi:hypothetical protein
MGGRLGVYKLYRGWGPNKKRGTIKYLTNSGGGVVQWGDNILTNPKSVDSIARHQKEEAKPYNHHKQGWKARRHHESNKGEVNEIENPRSLYCEGGREH